MNDSNILITRNKIKAKKPKFQRQDVNIFKQFSGEWRRPKGIHSKLRRGFKGHGSVPSIGYSSPSGAKGLTRNGFLPFIVSNLNDLDKVKDGFTVVISHSVGMKKKVQILNKIKERNLSLFNFKNVDIALEKLNEKINFKKRQAESRNEKKKKLVELQITKSVESNNSLAGDKKDEPKK